MACRENEREDSMRNVVGTLVHGSLRFIDSPTGKPGIAAEFVFDDDDPDEGTIERTATWEGWLSEKAEKRTLEALRLLGLTDDDIASGKFDRATREPVRLAYDDSENRIAFINGGSLGRAVEPARAEEIRASLARSLGREKPAADRPRE